MLYSNLPVCDIPLGTRGVSVSAHVSGKVQREFWGRRGHKPGRMTYFTHRPRGSEANTEAWLIRVFVYLRSQKKKIMLG